MKSEKDVIQTILLSAIVVDPNQPRKTFNNDSLEELSLSIKEHGLMQPITVRPIEGKKYMIIAGERRYRALLKTSLENISCIVKQGLTDEIILEMQIIENLQREEIDPIEESNSFLTLKKLGYSVEDIANKVGKSIPFVYQRCSLAELNDGFKKMVSEGIVSLTYALKISALNIIKQDSLFEILEGEWNKFQYEAFLKEESADLKDANFDLDISGIIEGVSACSTCPLNTINRGDLFSNGKQFCTDVPCFKRKKEHTFLAILEQAKKTNTLLIANDYSFKGYNSDNAIEVKVTLERNGFVAYGYGDGDLKEKPNDLLSFVDFIDEMDSDDDYKKEAYSVYVEDHNYEMEEWEKALKNKDYLRANKFSLFSLALINDTEILFKLHQDKSASINITEKKMDDCTNEEKIVKIKNRENRKKEIEASKLFNELYDLPHFVKNQEDLSDLEKLTFVISAIHSVSWNEKDELKKSLGSNADNFNKLLKNFDNGVFNRFVRVFIKSQLSTHENCSIAYNDINKAFYQIIKKADNKNVKSIENKYNNDENNRIKKMNERIDDLS